mgnify:CR=1 FL=1
MRAPPLALTRDERRADGTVDPVELGLEIFFLPLVLALLDRTLLAAVGASGGLAFFY